MDHRGGYLAVLAEDCVFDGTVGRGHDRRGLPFSLSSDAKILRFYRCVFLGNAAPVRAWKTSTIHFEDCVFKKNKEAKISKPKLIFYHESGEPIEVRGDQGHLYFADREIEKIRLQGKVEIHYQGFVLKTTEIVYLQEQDQVISQSKVAMKGEGLEMEGVGAEISLRDQKIRLQGDVKTRIEPKLLERNRIRPS